MKAPPTQTVFVTAAQATDVGDCLEMIADATPKRVSPQNADQLSLRQVMQLHLEKVTILRERGFTWEEISAGFQMADVAMSRDNAQVLYNRLTGRTQRKSRSKKARTTPAPAPPAPKPQTLQQLPERRFQAGPFTPPPNTAGRMNGAVHARRPSP